MSSSYAALAAGLLDERLNEAALRGAVSWGGLVRDRGPVVVVGSGGSYSGAEFLARLLRAHGVVARSVYPLDWDGPEKNLIAVSCSGRTSDIGEAIERVRRKRGSSVSLCTSSSDAELAAASDFVYTHGVGVQEREVLSFGATATCVAAVAGTFGSDAARRSVPGSLPPLGILDAPILDVIAGGWGWPAALDIEAKWVDAGLGEVRLHNAQNLIHDRYRTLLAESGTVVWIKGPERHDSVLAETLAGRDVVEISCGSGPLCGLSAMRAVQRLASFVGERLNRG